MFGKRRLLVIKKWLLDLPLIKKMFILFALAGIIPLCISFIVSYNEIYQFSLNSQKNMANQAYEQTFNTLLDKFSRIKKLSSNIATSKTINTSLKAIKTSKDSIEQYREYANISENLNNFFYSTEYDSITYFIKNDFNINQNTLPLFSTIGKDKESEINGRLKTSNRNVLWIPLNDNNINMPQYLSLCRYVIDLSNQLQFVGILVVNVDLNKIKDSFVISRPNQLIFLKTNDGELVLSNNDKYLSELKITPKVESQIKVDFQEININNKKYIARKNDIPDTSLELFTILPADSLNDPLFNSNSNIIILYFIICILMLLIIYTIAKSISKRILLLSNKMKKVKSGELDKLNIEEQKDEVGDLVTNYNFMIDEIHTLLQEQFDLGQEKKGAELKALQSQINPHFLYNTLDMINWMAQKNESENIRDTVFALSKYYRLILNKGRDIITIGDEIELCNAYIAIQQKRFKDKVKFIIDVDDNIKMYQIPKITLQPLIENAIIHGIAEKTDGRGTIIVSGWEEGENLILSVTDDGVGMEKQKGIDEKHTGSGYGISNIEMRLTLFYGMQQCIRYESTKDYGTCVSLVVKKVAKKVHDM